MYNLFVQPDFGKLRVQRLKKSDVRLFYNKLIEQRGLKINTVDGIHTVLHQVLELAVEAGVNIKVAQEALGHKDVSTTLDIYTDVTKELAQREFDNLEVKLQENFESLKKLNQRKTTSEETETDD